MKAILKWTLPEEEKEYRYAINGQKWQGVVWDIVYDPVVGLRNRLKYGNLDKKTKTALRGVWDDIIGLMDTRGVGFDE